MEHTQAYRINQWMGILKNCAQSGMQKKGDCKSHGINEKTFYYRQRRLGDQLSPALNAQITLRKGQSPSVQTAFVEMHSAQNITEPRGIAVLHYGQATISRRILTKRSCSSFCGYDCRYWARASRMRALRRWHCGAPRLGWRVGGYLTVTPTSTFLPYSSRILSTTKIGCSMSRSSPVRLGQR
ncbi:IS66 family insertion sequence element accessory protein TnpA, partial [Bacteroides sp.]|uniref:IS66 family insertion sequence element accessory protein TnpA n=1 Tax=Bacteroides sp. TaxID=29523 RepID=UPI003FA5703A